MINENNILKSQNVDKNKLYKMSILHFFKLFYEKI